MSKRILITSLFITLFILLIFAFTSNEVYYSQSEGDMHTRLREQLNTVESVAAQNDALPSAEQIALSLDGAEVTIFTVDGDMEDTTLSVGTETFSSEETATALASENEHFYVCPSVREGHTFVNLSKRIDDKLVMLTGEIISRSRMLATVLPSLGIFILVDVIVCLLFTWLSTTFILRPVKELAMEAIGNNKKIETRHAELKPVVDVINWKNEYVRAAQRSKDEFISNVTHEMNTPLTSIRGFAELIASGSMPKDKMIAAGKTIEAQSERLSAMIKRILNYSAIDDDTVKSYDVDASALTERVLDSYVPMLKDKDLTLLRRIEPGMIVSSTQERLTEILDNLISNAIKYNKQNGKIMVTLAGGVLTVEDTGIGISNEELPHIFSRFYTVDKSHGENVGFGLGLPIVRKLCDRSGWKLSVDSVFGEGTVFKVDFRVAHDKKHRSPSDVKN